MTGTVTYFWAVSDTGSNAKRDRWFQGHDGGRIFRPDKVLSIYHLDDRRSGVFSFISAGLRGLYFTAKDRSNISPIIFAVLPVGI